MSTYSINEVLQSLHSRLRNYLEAQYHIADETLIEERKLMLDEIGIISQTAYIESTPSYQQGEHFSSINLPKDIKEVFNYLSELKPGVGVFPKPYVHQINALEAFINDDKDLIVTTGTGSGKTECFLFPTIASIINEAANRNNSYKRKGVRALLLYPMNALVSDQLGRLRKMIGDERVVNYFQNRFGRHIKFGMYTSRTPYPGLRSSKKDQRYVKDILQYYINTMDKSPQLMKELKERGRWPAKDIRSFYGQEGAQWKNRLITSPNDAELFTRHEILERCPDILITNYSMLEYMLMRPIERSIFDDTKAWLEEDPNNKFILVLDEAHMYRGAAGAEVALLIRRLQNRLGIPRERMKCILTSASIGGNENTEQIAISFTESLTGRLRVGNRGFRVIEGVKKERVGCKPGSIEITNALSQFDLDSFIQRECDDRKALATIKELSNRLGFKFCIDNIRQVPNYLYNILSGFGPIELLTKTISGNALEFSKLAEIIFPCANKATSENALSSLLAIGTAARHEDGKVLLPTRLHLFYRGIPGIFACINPRCEKRRSKQNEIGLVGRLHTSPALNCSCSKRARVFELLTHRDCGAAFIRAFYRPEEPNFLWNERGGTLGQGFKEIHLFIGKPHMDIIDKIEPIWIDITTGLVRTDMPESQENFLHAYRPLVSQKENRKKAKQEDENILTFDRCPCCTEQAGRKIMDLATKGEQPFANLVRQQLQLQPPSHKPDKQYPNGGKKVLLFSDGRQKAARLARDIPREVELDTFRQVILLAAKKLQDINVEPTLTNKLYTSFVDVVANNNLILFDGESQEVLQRDVNQYVSDYIQNGEGLQEAYNEWERTEPDRYIEAILRQFCGPYYNTYYTCVAYLEPTNRARRRTEAYLSNSGLDKSLINSIMIIFIMRLMENLSFNADIPPELRWRVSQYSEWGDKGKLSKRLRTVMKRITAIVDDQLDNLERAFYENICTKDNGNKYYIAPDKVKIVIAAKENWYRCEDCTKINPITLNNHCVSCGSDNVKTLSNDSKYMQARKGFWRNPINDVLEGKIKPSYISAEEHSAQISQRDAGMVYASTEQYELRFQDIWLDDKKGPVDVLSCTTTMEVGIDIGSLTAVGLRNIPPARENYQQRAGRSGRRGSAISTVLTYSQGGPHDSYYFNNPELIISGEPREPKIYINNRKIAQRHINALLFQTFFHQRIRISEENFSGDLMSTLGKTHDFFSDEGEFTAISFKAWLRENLLESRSGIYADIDSLLPDELFNEDYSETKIKRISFISDSLKSLIVRLNELEEEVKGDLNDLFENEQDEDEINEELNNNLLEFLFAKGLLPTYAFPTDLSSFYVQKWDSKMGRVVIEQRPQQSMFKALSEYAPGRLIVIDKKTYRSGGIFKPNSKHAIDKAEIINWDRLPFTIYCDRCSYVTQIEKFKVPGRCPLCNEELKIMPMLEPIGFSPEAGHELSERDREQEISYANMPQFPLPVDEEKFEWINLINSNFKYTFANNKSLIIINKGPDETGFDVCTKCGAAWPHDNTQLGHKRPYLLDRRIIRNVQECTGEIKNVLLGHSFNSDLLIIRISIEDELDSNPNSIWLQDCLRTFAEALTLAASRALDIDYNELSAGYRFIPSKRDNSNNSEIDIFLFDTLSGGAGYSFSAGEQITEVLNKMDELLKECNCDSSCYNCLRHYGNQFYHHQLDRHLAHDLLKYIKDNVIPNELSIDCQIEKLLPLKRMLELQGISTKVDCRIEDVRVPLLIYNGNKRLAVGVYNTLLNSTTIKHSLNKLTSFQVFIEREYILRHDLPSVVNRIMQNSQ